ncbi:MAG: hypothetical protein ABW158_06025 [Candidatus Thiodiazotropha sp. 6PDIVS]
MHLLDIPVAASLMLFVLSFDLVSSKGQKPFFAYSSLFSCVVFITLSVTQDSNNLPIIIFSSFLILFVFISLLLHISLKIREDLFIIAGVVIQVLMYQWLIDTNNQLTNGDHGLLLSFNNNLSHPDPINLTLSSLGLVFIGLLVRYFFWNSTLGKRLLVLSFNNSFASSLGILRYSTILATSFCASVLLAMSAYLIFTYKGILLASSFDIQMTLLALAIVLTGKHKAIWFYMIMIIVAVLDPLIRSFMQLSHIAPSLSSIFVGTIIIVYTFRVFSKTPNKH